jgi:hypothetical protein
MLQISQLLFYIENHLTSYIFLLFKVWKGSSVNNQSVGSLVEQRHLNRPKKDRKRPKKD